VIYLYLEQFQKKIMGGASSFRSSHSKGSKEQAPGSVAGD
jgi:hypothetical protein